MHSSEVKPLPYMKTFSAHAGVSVNTPLCAETGTSGAAFSKKTIGTIIVASTLPHRDSYPRTAEYMIS